MDMLTQPVTGDGAWTSSTTTKADMTLVLTPAQIERLEDMAARSVGKEALDLTRADVDDPVIADLAKDILARVRDRHGVALLSGLSRARFSDDMLTRIFWGIGRHLGEPESQSILGDKVGHVRKAPANPNNRGYRSDRELFPHTDSTDIAGLLCLRSAKAGGVSQFVSGLAIHNELLANHPDLLPALYAGYYFHRSGEQLPHEAPITPTRIPIFAYYEGALSVYYLRGFIDMAARELEPDGKVPADLKRSLDAFDALTSREDMRIAFTMEEGEMVFMNNHVVLHARTAFEDFPEEEKHRHLLRLWLSVPDLRPVSPAMNVHGAGGIKGQPDKVKEFEHAK